MTIEAFWKIIEEARNTAARVTDIPGWLTGFLRGKSAQDVMEFEEQKIELFVKAYDARLWAAASLMMDSCGDDTFMDFRGWLIAQGKSVYEQALENPDSLVDSDQKSGDHGLPLLFYLSSVAQHVYTEKTAEFQIPLDYSKCHHPNLQLLNKEFQNYDTAGLSAIFPRLYAKYEERRSKLPKSEPVFKPID